jgi:hypothetical protein
LKAVAVVLSYGRPELGELFTMWSKQTRRTPLLVWLDGYAGEVIAPVGVHVHHSPRIGENHSIGAVRSAAVEFARELYSLGPSDGFLVLDDDDYYSPSHAARTVKALELAPYGWTGAARVAYQWHRDMMPPDRARATAFGPGQHAAWAMRMDVYDAAGGYLGTDSAEDVRLADRIGWAACATHTALTHVRRQFGSTLSAVLKGVGPSAVYDRDTLRRDLEAPPLIRATWRPELTHLECWTLEHEEVGGDGL